MRRFGASNRPEPRNGIPVAEAIRRAIDWFLSAQNPTGYWWGELEADTTLESDYILYLQILGELKSEKTAKLAKYIRDRQLPDGGWNIFYGGPSELNATVTDIFDIKQRFPKIRWI